MTSADVGRLIDEWAAACRLARRSGSLGRWDAAGKLHARVLAAVDEHGPVRWRGELWEAVRDAYGPRLSVRPVVVPQPPPEKVGGFISQQHW